MIDQCSSDGNIRSETSEIGEENRCALIGDFSASDCCSVQFVTFLQHFNRIFA